jgi:plastocyanin
MPESEEIPTQPTSDAPSGVSAPAVSEKPSRPPIQFGRPGCLFLLALALLGLLGAALAIAGLFGWLWIPPWIWLIFIIACLLLLLLLLWGLFRLVADATACTVTLTGPDCLCDGASKTYKASGSPAGGSYRWTSQGDIEIVQTSADSATVKAKDDSETATLTVTYTKGGGSATASKTLRLACVDSIEGPDCGCIGKSVTFTAKTDLPGCEADVEWTDGTHTGTGATFTTSFTAAGKYTIKAKCGKTEKTFDFEACELKPIEPVRRFLRPSGVARFTGRTAAGWTAAVPAAVQAFSVASDPCDCDPADINWTAAGPAVAPAAGNGRNFTATFSAPGAYTVTVSCHASTRAMTLQLCDFRASLERAANYYRNSIDFLQVTVDFGGTISGRAWTFHNDISLPDVEELGFCTPASLFVHEFGHVWEYQHGQLQMIGGIIDQIHNTVGGVFTGGNPAYDYGGAAGAHSAVAAGKTIDSFNREQQASIFEHDFIASGGGGAFTPAHAADLAALTGPALAAPPNP